MKKKHKKGQKWYKKIIAGAIFGLINGFLGSGGGMLAVPILEKIDKLDEKKSHATALAVIFPFSLISAIIYTINFEINWVTALILIGGVSVGGVIGAIFLKKLNNKAIRIIFAIVMIITGVYLIWN